MLNMAKKLGRPRKVRRKIQWVVVGLLCLLATANSYGELTAKAVIAGDKASTKQYDRQYEVDIVAQDIADALTLLAEQTHSDIIFSYEIVENRYSSRVKGLYTVTQALTILLK